MSECYGSSASEKIPIRKAGKYTILEQTLRRKLTEKNKKKTSLGRRLSLGEVNEQKLATHVLKLQAAGFAPTRKILC